ncbi:uncharacterized protein LOC128253875 [Drosophila gunungcola]|uniref:uncharacterized protein LOC128253875 n=1 Tax=Drosophila gunungcola TaxID=103775 RepID=UPI0022E1FD48|nr:uncharacterized protein LOC128253875 [Drosophila gunungcola]
MNRCASNMQSHLIAILLASVAIGSCLANPSLISGPSRMMEVMSATSESQRNNPQLAAACFAYYNEVFNSDYEEYEVEYNQCHDKYNGGREEALTRYDPVVWKLSNSTAYSCNYMLNICDDQFTSQNSLNCYAKEGVRTSKVLASVAFNASEFYGALSQEIEQIAYTRELCCNTSARNYEIRSDESYASFQSCLLGLTPVPDKTTTTSSTTSWPTTTTSTTRVVSEITNDRSSIISSSIISHFESDEGNSAISKHRWGRKLYNAFKHNG